MAAHQITTHEQLAGISDEDMTTWCQMRVLVPVFWGLGIVVFWVVGTGRVDGVGRLFVATGYLVAAS